MDAFRLQADHIAGVGRKSSPFFLLCIVGPGAIIEPVVLDVTLGAVDPGDHGPGGRPPPAGIIMSAFDPKRT